MRQEEIEKTKIYNLRASLEEEVGDVLGGARGRRLLEATRAKRDALLTATGKPRGELATVREARVTLGAVATRVRFMPSGSQTIRKGDQEVLAEETMQVTEATRFALEGFGTVDVEPGASDLADRRLGLKEAEKALAKALAAAEVADLDEARAKLAERTEAETLINEAKRLIAAYAPEGLDRLKAAHGDKCAERKQLDKRLDMSPVGEIADPETHTLVAAKAAEETARTALDNVREERWAHATDLAIAQRAMKSAEQGLRRARGDLEATRAEISEADLAARLKNAREALSKAEHQKAETERQIAAANPEEVELRREQTSAALQNVEAEQRRLREAAIGLENKLTALGKNGIGELLEEARGHGSSLSPTGSPPGRCAGLGPSGRDPSQRRARRKGSLSRTGPQACRPVPSASLPRRATHT